MGDHLVDAARVLAQLQSPLFTMDGLGYLTSWNLGAQLLYGYSTSEVLGQHVLFLYAQNASQKSDADIEEFFQIDDRAVLRVQHCKKSGVNFQAELSLSVLRDDDGHVVCFVGILTELDASLSATDKLNLHASIIANSDQGILITDGNERIVSVNAAFTRITGYSVQEAVGQSTDLLRSGVHDATFRAQGRSALHGAGDLD